MSLILNAFQQSGGITISSDLLISLLGAVGISAVVPMIAQYFLKRREKVADRHDAAEEAQVEDSGKIRQELWAELKAANERNDALSARYGAVLQEKAQIAGQLAASEDQNKALIARLTTEGMRVSDAEDRAKRDRAARDQAEQRYAFLVERHAELERDYARISRGGATRKSDLEPTGAESDRTAPDRRATDRIRPKEEP